MNDRRQRNPGADRRLWNEPRGRGRTLVWWIAVPLAAGTIALAGFASTHPRFQLTLPFGQNAPAAVANDAKAPAFTYVATPAPAEAAEQDAPAKRSTTRRSR
jgi:hypothetical protein